MAANEGTLVIAPIRPNDSLDSYATAHANEILGGLHAVVSLEQRDAIPIDRRLAGMLCNVLSDNAIYQLLADLTTWTKIPISYSESQTGRIDVIDLIPHHLISRAREERKIVGLRLYLRSGTCSVTLKINDAALPEATALAITSTPIQVNLTTNNIVQVNDLVALEISDIAMATYLQFQVDYKIN